MPAHTPGRAGADWLLRQFNTPGKDIGRVVARVRTQPELVETLIEGLGSTTAGVKFGSAKSIWLLSEAQPELLYPRFDFFLGLLDADNSVLRWNAARTLAGLAAADREGKMEAALDKYLGVIPGPEMIAAATAIQGGAAIAIAQPRLAGRIASAVLGVAKARYKTDECRNIAIGHAILALDRFFGLIEDPNAVLRFVESQTENPRPATRKKALAFLKKHTALVRRLSKAAP